MANPAKEKGSRAEREVAAFLSDELGRPMKRALGAGRKEDCGDIWGCPSLTVQVANCRDINRAIREKLPDVETQRLNAGAEFGAMFVRRTGGSYVVVLEPTMFCKLLREAIPVATASQSPVVKEAA